MFDPVGDLKINCKLPLAHEVPTPLGLILRNF
jgi:hypothetical protein